MTHHPWANAMGALALTMALVAPAMGVARAHEAAGVAPAPPLVDGWLGRFGAPPVTDGAVQAHRMRLIGNLPGSNGSFAFWGDVAVVNRWASWPASGPDDGFVTLDVSDPTQPRQLSRFRCTASYFDISIWRDLVFLSQNEPTAGTSCDAAGTSPNDPDAFAGVRIVSIADPTNPVPVAAVRTGVQTLPTGPMVWGSHTHTPVPDLDHRAADGRPAPRLVVYSADGIGPGMEPHASIVEVPLRDPSAARVVGTIDNGTHAPCHDISVFMPRNLLACAAYDAGVILFDISDPLRPARLSHFDNPFVEANHHSTTFSNDGSTLVLNDERATALFARTCAGGTGAPLGAVWFYDISDPRAPQEEGFFQLPRTTVDHFCYPHESNVVPMPGPRDILVTGWFGGGVNLVDFTDPSQPREIAFWVRSGLDAQHSFPYAGYWYNGLVYAANTALHVVDEPVTDRGFDVFAADHPALREAIRLRHLNAQTQEHLPQGRLGRGRAR